MNNLLKEIIEECRLNGSLFDKITVNRQANKIGETDNGEDILKRGSMLDVILKPIDQREETEIKIKDLVYKYGQEGCYPRKVGDVFVITLNVN